MFRQLFYESPGKPVFHKYTEVFRAISLEAPQKLRLVLTFIENNSKNRQGVMLSLFTMKGTLSCNGQTTKKGGYYLWEDSSPRQIIFDTKIVEGDLGIFNIAERNDYRGKPYAISLDMGMAICYERIETNKYRFFCNDWEPDDDFNDLIFDLEIMPQSDEKTHEPDSFHFFPRSDPERHILVFTERPDA